MLPVKSGASGCLSPTSAFAEAVAESALSMAIDLVRGITAADRAFRAGNEKWGLDGNETSFMFTRAPVGIIGFGDLGRKFRALIAPFRNPVAVYDPWLPDDLVRSHDCEPVGLDDLPSASPVWWFVFASVTTDNQGFLGKREFELMQPGSAFLLMSRAAVVDFPEFLRQVRSGRIMAATDVFPRSRSLPTIRCATSTGFCCRRIAQAEWSTPCIRSAA